MSLTKNTMQLLGYVAPDTPPSVIAGYLQSDVPRKAVFTTLMDARDELLQLILGQFAVIYMNEEERAEYLRTLDRWSDKFDRLRSVMSNGPEGLTPSNRRTVALLRLHKRGVTINLANVTGSRGAAARDVMMWDDSVDEYDEMLRDAAVALGLDDDGRPSRPEGDARQFHLEFGVMTAILFVAARCRDPLVRRKALCLILAAPAQEGIWSNMLVARVARRLIDMEESGRVVRSCSDVPPEVRLQQTKVVIGRGDKRAKIQLTFPYGVVEEWIEWQ